MRSLLPHFIIITFTSVLLYSACKKDIKGPSENLSAIGTVHMGFPDAGIPYYTLDRSGNYLYVFIRDIKYANGVALKINTKTLGLEKKITLPGSVPISPDNIVLTDNDNLIGTFFNFKRSAVLVVRFDAELNWLKTDTIAFGPGGNYGRIRLIKKGPGQITGVSSNKVRPKGKCYLTYKKMDDDLKVISQISDSSGFYGYENISGTNLINTSDGGYLFTADNFDTLYYTAECLLEKRDADFNLQWRVKYIAPNPYIASPTTLLEYNNKYYVYCSNNVNPQTAFILVYDKDGNLLQNTTFKVDGMVFKSNLSAEAMRLTDNGEILVLTATRLNSSPNLQKGMLIRTDANLNVLSTEIYGDQGVKGSLIKTGPDRFLHFYQDNSFTLEDNLGRIVLRYLDGKGKFIRQ